jgi:hypothetical protein
MRQVEDPLASMLMRAGRAAASILTSQVQITGTDIFSFDPKSKGAVASQTLITELV